MKNNKVLDGYRISKRKRSLISKDFLKRFKKLHDEYFIIEENVDETYYGWYSWYIGTETFDYILKLCCREFNIYNAIYLFSKRLSNDDYFIFLEDIVKLMVDFNLIEIGCIPVVGSKIRSVKGIKGYKGYNVICYLEEYRGNF